MITLLLLLGLLIGINFIPQLTKTNFPKTEKVILRILIVSTFLFLTLTIFEYNGYRLKGNYTFSAIGLTFIISALLYFAIFKNTKKKILTIFLITPLIVLSIVSLLFWRVIKEFRINNQYKIEVTKYGRALLGEQLAITESRYIIFSKEIHHMENVCLSGISRIEIITFDNKQAEFLIYHNAEWDSENPYKYRVENKNLW
jgi:ABC-2 type transport system permease protein